MMGMKALLGFAPFAAFALIEKLVGIVPGLAAGLAMSLALIVWDALRHRPINILEVGSAVIFGGLAIWALCEDQAWSIWQVRLYVDAGLALTVLLSVLAGRPFTAQSGRSLVSPEVARSRDFMRHNILLSGVWGLAFVGLAAIDLIMTTHPDLSDRNGILLTLAVLAAAAKFTIWYAKRIRSAA
jgi:intracellular septation protein A